MATLFVFGGLMGSGSLEKAREYANHFGLPLVEADEVRKELPNLDNTLLFEEIQRRLKKRLDKNEDLVYYATNLYSRQRKHLVSIMKPHKTEMTFVMRSIDRCIEEDAKKENAFGEDMVIQKFITTDIPFGEGFSRVNYSVEFIPTEVIAHYLSESQKREETLKDDVIRWADVFMEAGKPLLETREEKAKSYGYNNMSAQIAFQTLYTMNYHVEFIEQVVQLILYKKRYRSADEKGKETLRKQLGAGMMEKLKVLMAEK